MLTLTSASILFPHCFNSFSVQNCWFLNKTELSLYFAPSASPWRPTAAASRNSPPGRRSARDHPAASSAGRSDPSASPSVPPDAPSSPARSDRRNTRQLTWREGQQETSWRRDSHTHQIVLQVSIGQERNKHQSFHRHVGAPASQRSCWRFNVLAFNLRVPQELNWKSDRQLALMRGWQPLTASSFSLFFRYGAE